MDIYIRVLFSTLVFFRIQGNWRNVALNKPAFQVSTDLIYYATPEYLGFPSHAVDGNKDTLQSCIGTQTDWNPWWMVDLGKLHLIKHVELTSILFPGDKLRNFTIEISKHTNGDPSRGILVNPTLCHYCPHTQLAGSTVIYPCLKDTTGRYVRISSQNKDKKQPLFFCEVQIHGTDMELLFKGNCLAGRRSLNPTVGVLNVTSVIQCFTMCRNIQSCSSFNIQQWAISQKICELIADPIPWVFDNEEHQASWDHCTVEA